MAFDLEGGVVVEQVETTKSKTYEEKIEAVQQKLAVDQRTVPVDGVNGAWIVVVTKPGREHSVHDQLVRQGFEVFLPLQPLARLQAERRGVAAIPFFARTLFARATLDAHRWQAIFSTIGVQRVMCDPAKPKGVTDAFVQRLRANIFDQFLAIGLQDPSRPKPAAKVKDRRQWLKLGDVLDGLMAEPVAERRESVLLNLLSEGHPAVIQILRR